MTNPCCPECGSAGVHRSHRRHALERLIAVLGGSMRRCHDCNSRFATFGTTSLRVIDLQKISQNVLLFCAMAGAAALILAATLWFSRSPSPPANDTSRIMILDVPSSSS